MDRDRATIRGHSPTDYIERFETMMYALANKASSGALTAKPWRGASFKKAEVRQTRRPPQYRWS